MKILNRLAVVLLVITLLTALLSITAFADSETVEPAPIVSLDDIEFVFTYTSDSVVKEGLVYRIYTDPISDQVGVELVPEFGIGYALYDDPNTEYIDGIRINGTEVTSLRIPISADSTVFKYDIAVKTVYKENASGDLAKILDGTFDYSELLTNPIILFQGIYWAFMAITALVGLILILANKKQKVKTSDEIASKVDVSVDVLRKNILDIVEDVVKAEILPLAQASVKSGKEAVKAILISTSKSKDAPSALLDIFKESSDIDIANIVDEVREELLKRSNTLSERHSENINTLHNIATNVIQEDVTDATKTEEIKTQKSLF